ncbi:MAG: rod shape-determining protein MreC [Chitinophagaceae bacterium]|nr:MAG: rod shape-determining protein MreC [Chitinophagaceae bacterium]
MRNIFAFIRRHFVFLAFVVLEILSLWMLFSYNSHHRAVFLGVANEVTGSINRQVDKVDDYFHLVEENRRVHRMNDSLLNLMKANFNVPDTSAQPRTDSVRQDSLVKYRRWLYRDAKVVYNSVNFENNYIQLNRGANQGIRDNMAVIASDGAVIGVIVNTSPNFSQVLSLLHSKSNVPSALKKTGTIGTVRWDGLDPRFVVLQGISKDVDVKPGDSVLTSPYAYNYPPGFLIGRIAKVAVNKATGFYELKVQTAVNFATVQQVFVIENLQRSEQLQLESETEKKIEQVKPRTR